MLDNDSGGSVHVLMYRLVRFSKRYGIEWFVGVGGESVIGVAVGRDLLHHGHELRADGVGVGPVMSWPDTPTGRMRALMYKDLLNGRRV